MHSIPPEFTDVLHDLAKSIEALDRHAEASVLTGGLAVWLYRYFIPGAHEQHSPLTTFDIDWAVPSRFQPPFDVGIHSKLERAGFVAFVSGSHDLPVTRYQLARHGTAQLAPIHVEFIAPRDGSKRDRKGTNKGIIEVEPGLFAQTDPYLSLLFMRNIRADVRDIPLLGISHSVAVRLPNPACLIIQKSLIRHRRETPKRDNDAAHMYDIALTTRPIWEQLASDVAHLDRSDDLPGKWLLRARRDLSQLFAAPDAAGSIAVARVYQNTQNESSPPTPSAVHRVMTAFLRAVGLEAK